MPDTPATPDRGRPVTQPKRYLVSLTEQELRLVAGLVKQRGAELFWRESDDPQVHALRMLYLDTSSHLILQCMALGAGALKEATQ
jgi:hypothetical protein